MKKILTALVAGAFLFATVPAWASKDQAKAEKVAKAKKQQKKAK